MVVEVHAAGPGDESWRSTRFTAKINNLESFVYGHTENTDMPTICWEQGDSVEHSWIKYGADEDVTLVIAKADGTDISSATVYPKNAGYTQRIAHGSLYLKVVPNTNLYVEINGDRKHTLSIIGQRPKPPLPTDYIDWPTRELTVSNVDTVNNVITVTDHGIPNGGFQRVALNSTGDLPTTSQGTLAANHELVAVYIDQHTLALVSNLVPLQFSSAGTGTLTMSLMDLNEGTIYFGAGVHHIGRTFRAGSNTRFYFDEGAVVVGSFDVRRYINGAPATTSNAGDETITTGVVFEGPGILAGTYARRADVLPISGSVYDTMQYYAAIYGVAFGYDGLRPPTTNRVTGVTVFKHPFFLNILGVGDFDQCSYISPWNYNADGFQPVSRTTGELGYVRGCYVFAGDDACKLQQRTAGPLYLTRCFFVACANSAISFGARPNPAWTSDSNTITVQDVDLMYLARQDTGIEQNETGTAPVPPLGERFVIKSLTDGYDGSGEGEEDQESLGPRHILIKDIRMYPHDLEGRPIGWGNLRYPFGGAGNAANQRQQHGNTGFVVFEDIYVEGVPPKSRLLDHDANNTASNITIRNMQVGGTRVTTANKDSFWGIDPYVYNVTFDTPRVTDPYAGGQ